MIRQRARLFAASLACALLAACSGGGSGSSPVPAAAPVSTPAAAASPVAGAAPPSNVRIGAAAGDDWEPYLAADRFGHLYAAYTHQNGAHILLQRSDDGGATWTAPVSVDPTPGATGQFDPWIAIDPADGKTVWVSYMEGSPAQQIRAVRSSDLGATWSAPVAVSGALSGLDKDAMAMRNGTIAVCFDNGSTITAAISHDSGATWAQHPIMTFATAPVQFLCSGAAIDSAGTIAFAFGSSDASGVATTPAAQTWIERSVDGGTTWTTTHVADGGAAYPCSNCGEGAFFGSQMSLAVGSDDTLYVAWNANASSADASAQRIFFASSSDRGATFSAPQDVSLAAAGVEHSFPTVLAGTTPGDVRVGWEDQRGGAWNVRYRASTTSGAAWGPETVLSNDPGGYAYLTPAGFAFPYGDYFRMTLDAGGKLHAAWGESSAYVNAGNVWVANP